MKRPAPRRQYKREHTRVHKSYSPWIRLFLVSLIVLITLTLLFFTIWKSKWNGRDRLSIVIPKESGEVLLVILDPQVDELITLTIPAKTQVNVARELGEWKIGSVWKLGIQEKLGGQLLTDTVTKSFRLPVDGWLASEGTFLVQSRAGGMLRGLFSPYTSSFSLVDRWKIAFYSFKTAGRGRVNIALEDTGYLEEVRLADGEDGYKIRKTIPTSLIKLFYVPEITSERALVKVVDASAGDNARRVADVVSVLGAKVVAIENAEFKDIDCVVKGSKQATVAYIARAFSCKIKVEDREEEVLVEFGRLFDKRF